jgi:hypothetical protein
METTITRGSTVRLHIPSPWMTVHSILPLEGGPIALCVYFDNGKAITAQFPFESLVLASELELEEMKRSH